MTAPPIALQWGHAKICVETPTIRRWPLHLYYAAMGPRKNLRGNLQVEKDAEHPFIGCNGATQKFAWKRDNGSESSRRRPPCCNGATQKFAWKRRSIVGHTSRFGELQWGHAKICVETVVLFSSRSCRLLLQWGHAKICVETVQVAVVTGVSLELQWGHAKICVETGE